MKIRAYYPKDKENLIQLWLDCGLVVAHNNPEQDIQRKLKENPDWLFIAEESGNLIGSCMVGYDGHRGWIYYLGVAPDCQRRGIASDLMKHAEDLLKSIGCPKINLMVRDSNQEVIDFYRSINYGLDPVVTLSKRLEEDKPFQIEPVAGDDAPR
jgi:ribosomal protein S18 acetylase RimI-like enzyme